MVLGFGMPSQPALSRKLEADDLPIAITTWEDHLIRYTQTVLVTRLQEGDLVADNQWPPDAVLLVRLHGECLASEYTDARAGFSLSRNKQSIPLHLADDLIYQAGHTAAPMASIDIPTGGVAEEAGDVIRFHGNMPPSITGAMVIKIPLAPMGQSNAIEQLRLMNFDDEFRRVKRFWSQPTFHTNVLLHPIRLRK